MCVYDKESTVCAQFRRQLQCVYVCVRIRGNVAYGVKYIDWATTFEMCC